MEECTRRRWVPCRELFDDTAVVEEFLYLVAGYQMFATVSASMDEPTDEAFWLPDGTGPTGDVVS